VHQNRNAQLAAYFPYRIPSRIVDPNQASVSVLPSQTEVLEKLQATDVALFDLRSESCDALKNKGILVAHPTRWIILDTSASKIDVRKDGKPIWVFGPQIARVGLKLVTKLTVERYAYRDPVSIHDLNISIQQLLVMFALDEEMSMNIDHRKTGSCDLGLTND
jgi:hypothetical protein